MPNRRTHPIDGVLAAAVTPLTDDGDELDEAVFGPLGAFYADSGLDGVLALGTTGEGILLDPPERRRAVELFQSAANGRLKVVAHCGAQTTRDTMALAAHAADTGVAGVAVIPPPYFALDDRSLLAHLAAAARACAPVPFYIYEFAARSGYSVPVHVIEELRGIVDNLAGLKVSDAPWEKFQPYLLEGLAIFVGPERLISQGMAGGAVGAVSALAAVLPELVIEAVRSATPAASERCFQVRESIHEFPFHSSMKMWLSRRGIPIGDGVRRPLRQLTSEERRRLAPLVDSVLTNLETAIT